MTTSRTALHKSHFFLFVVLIASIITTGIAAPGDQLAKITVPVPSGLGVSVAVDCDGFLYYTNSYSANLYKIKSDGTLVNTIPLKDSVTGNPISFGAMAFDISRNAIWAGTDNQGSPVQVYLINLATGIATYKFTAATPGFGFADGLAYDGTDDSIWVSDDS